MGTALETLAASHIVEGNNKTLIIPELVHRRAVSKQPLFKFSLVIQGQFYYKLTPRKWERAFKKYVIINILNDLRIRKKMYLKVKKTIKRFDQNLVCVSQMHWRLCFTND